MKRPIVIAYACVAAVLIFCGGLFTGRQFPAHHYVQFGQSIYLYDTASGRVCTIKRPQVTPPEGFVLDGTKDANGFAVVKPAPPTEGNLLDQGLANPKDQYPICGE
jgi:hypothetical protein